MDTRMHISMDVNERMRTCISLDMSRKMRKHMGMHMGMGMGIIMSMRKGV